MYFFVFDKIMLYNDIVVIQTLGLYENVYSVSE